MPSRAPVSPVSPPDSGAGAVHADAIRAVQALARVSRVLERAGADLSLAHYRVLAAVAAGDERASRVAQRLALGKPAVSATVEALCRRGLLARTDEAVDQRATTLRLTAEGKRTLGEVESEMARQVEQLCARTPRPAELMADLGLLGDAIEEMLAERASATGVGR